MKVVLSSALSKDIEFETWNELRRVLTKQFGKNIDIFDLDNNSSFLNDIEKEEIVVMRTEAISNMKRYQLNHTQLLKKKEKNIIIKILLSYYQEIFKLNKIYHYYPAINLSYMIVIFSLVDENKQTQQNLKYTIHTIYEKTKKTIQVDKKRINLKYQYYANITELEFLFLEGDDSAVDKLEKYLTINEDNLPQIELRRTQRQMQFFVNTAINLYGRDIPLVARMKKPIEIIDAFIKL